jgi:hypothetical protein
VQLKKGDIIAVSGTGFLSEAIEVVTHSPVSHIAIVVNPEKLKLIEAYKDVRYRNLKDYKGMCNVYRVEHLEEEQLDKLIDYLTQQLKKPYDYFDIVRELARYTLGSTPIAEDGEAFICSSLCAMAYASIGIKLTDEPLPSPADIVASHKLTRVGGY